MNTKNITYSAVFSAIFILLSVIAISTGIAYTLFLDVIVPIYICIVFFKLDRKQALFMSITSLTIVFFVLGNVIAAVWMAQGMIIGFICTLFISKDSSIFDDLLLSSVLATFIIIFVDIYFSTLTGYSLIKDSEEILQTVIMAVSTYNPNIILPEYYSSLVIYLSIATIPVGTVIVVYLGAMFLGNKLRILDKNTKRKFNIIKQFNKYGALLCCSKEAYKFSIVYVAIVEFIKAYNIEITMDYLRVVIMSVEVIFFYFIIKDSLSFVMKYIIIRNKSKALYKLSLIFSVFSLLTNFRITFLLLVAFSWIINKKIGLRQRQIKILESV